MAADQSALGALAGHDDRTFLASFLNGPLRGIEPQATFLFERAMAAVTTL